MSAAHTWFGRSITRSRSRYGKILCPGAGFVVRGFGPRAAIPISRISRCTRLRLTGKPLGPQHRRHPPRAEERPGGEQRVDPPHQRQIVVVVRAAGR